MPGIISSYIHTGNCIGVLVEVSCQTDITARTPALKAVAQNVALQIAACLEVEYVAIESIEQQLQTIWLLNQPHIKDPTLTVGDLMKQYSIQLGESIQIRRFVRYVVGERIPPDESPPEEFPPDTGSGVPRQPLPNSPSLVEEALILNHKAGHK